MSSIGEALVSVLVVGMIVYHLALGGSYLILLWLAGRDSTRRAARTAGIDHADLLADPDTPGISLIVPARDEEAVVVDVLCSLLALTYPRMEIILVDDGSTDATADRVAAAYPLVEVNVVPDPRVTVGGQIHSVWEAVDGTPLRMVSKDSLGTKPDAVNAGIALARYELVAVVDADTVVDPDALLEAVRPFVDRPERTVAVGGVVRPANGSILVDGRISQLALPDNWWARMQVVEYVRSFQLARIAWAELDGVLIISGAFGLFDRETVIEIGGFDTESVGEDFELVLRLHRRMREQGRGHRDYEVAFLATPVCWTEVPETWAGLSSQRRRWARGLLESLASHRQMIGSPRYGRLGLVALPYLIVFELLGPLIQLAGTLAVVAGVAFGFVEPGELVLVMAVALGSGSLVTVLAAAIDASASSRRWRPLDATRLMAAVLVEHLGFRLLVAFWHARGVWTALVGAHHEPWVNMDRRGFSVAQRPYPH